MTASMTPSITLNIKYFASIREALSSDGEIFTGAATTVVQLKSALSTQSLAHAAALAHPRLCVAVNQQMVKHDATLHSDDEVAFFPPVTGG